MKVKLKSAPWLVKDLWYGGKVLRACSEKFGTHDLFLIRCPGKSVEEKRRAIQLDLPSAEALYFSSFENDTVEKEWESLNAYYLELSGGGEP